MENLTAGGRLGIFLDSAKSMVLLQKHLLFIISASLERLSRAGSAINRSKKRGRPHFQLLA